MKTYLNIKQVSEFCRASGWGYSDDGQPRAFSDEQFKKIAELLGNFEGNPRYRALFERLAMWICGALRPGTALEFGCGPGYLIYCLNRLGVVTSGIDGNNYFWKDFQLRHYDLRNRYILDPVFEKKVQQADVFVSIEVFEHIPDTALHNIMSRVREEVKPHFIVFSSTPYEENTPHWDLQWGHINLKQPDEWRAFFGRYGYQLEAMKPPITHWAQLYKRA